MTVAFLAIMVFIGCFAIYFPSRKALFELAEIKLGAIVAWTIEIIRIIITIFFVIALSSSVNFFAALGFVFVGSLIMNTMIVVVVGQTMLSHSGYIRLQGNRIIPINTDDEE